MHDLNFTIALDFEIKPIGGKEHDLEIIVITSVEKSRGLARGLQDGRVNLGAHVVQTSQAWIARVHVNAMGRERVMDI